MRERRKDPAQKRKEVNWAKSYQKKNPDKVKRWKAIGRRRHRKELTAKEIVRVGVLNGSLRKVATQHYELWGPVEDCQVMRADISLRHIAKLLGRTYHSVADRRAALRRQDQLPIAASESSTQDDLAVHAIASSVSTDQADALPDSIEWMPAGQHAIYASKAGKPHKLTMNVKESDAALANRCLQEINAKADAGEGPHVIFDFNHEDREASAHPSEFYWQNGIRAKVKWTGAGERAVRGRDYTRFSPSFYPDKDGNLVGIPANAGGLVNFPAFQKIQSVVRSKSAGADEDSAEQETKTKKASKMETLMAVLAKLGLLTSANLDEATAVTQVTAKMNEITQGGAQSAAALVEANKTLETTKADLVTAKKAVATTIVEAAIQAGRLPGQNEEVKAFWIASIEANPANAKALPEPNAALQQIVQASGKDKGKTDLSGGAEHPFLAKVHEYQASHKSSEAFAIEAVARTKEGAGLYEDYRKTLFTAKAA